MSGQVSRRPGLWPTVSPRDTRSPSRFDMNKKENVSDLNRRDFLKGGSFATLMMMMGGVPLQADDQPKPAEGETKYKTDAPPLNCAVIGCGIWGRQVLNTLATLPNAPVVAVCD